MRDQYLISCVRFIKKFIALCRAAQPTPLEPIIAALVRFAAPLVFAYYLIQISFRLGIKRKTDKCALHCSLRILVHFDCCSTYK